MTLPEDGLAATLKYPLFEALFKRRSRRFGQGMEIVGGPTAYRSEQEPVPLSDIEEELLIAAAMGITGPILLDFPFQDWDGKQDRALFEGGAKAMQHLRGQTFPSPSAAYSAQLVYSNDRGLFAVNLRDVIPTAAEIDPNDPDAVRQLMAANTVRLGDRRIDIPRSQPALFSINLWSVNRPGTTMFMPVSDCSYEYINLLLAFCEETGYTIIDDINGGRPCGNEQFIGTLLNPDLKVPLSKLEAHFCATANMEQAFMVQNIQLAAQAMGLGSFAFGGFNSLIGMGGTPLSRGMGFRFVQSANGGLNPVGIDGVFEAFAPPYFSSMSDAVDETIERKWSKPGVFADFAKRRPMGADAKISQPVISPYRPETVACVKRICEYVYEAFGQFPGTQDTMQTHIWQQVHHLDLDYYDRFFPGDGVTDSHRRHFELWHGEPSHGKDER